ncbi:type II toxin-antitoxin system RelE/ParE family toxin [Geomesophilobacter sediminis]|uniref:Toxin n=1 Tax=Geomesophilobacter sediminis TaxID=2798584 RepID=A0A8J7IR41_9BACT|nr:type II toxin-antitoxin system RelE/ParE family toxin [Geomesophilobacter sediminis]MBJ6725269.1 type II toxin-antitoxin system RelE/ParE family toxin [Geomesophilobacter sediminis]
MALFTLTERAKEDLKEIGRYTEAKWGRSQRNKYLGSRHHVFQQLAADPLKGKDCSDIRFGYRKANAGSHVIFYRTSAPDTIEVVRILHARMDLESRISGS